MRQHLTDLIALGAPISPTQLTSTTTMNSGSVDMSVCTVASFLFQNNIGSGTLSFSAQIQESANGVSWSNNTTVPAITTSAGAVLLEIARSQLGTGMRYVRLQVVCTVGGTTPSILVAGIPFGVVDPLGFVFGGPKSRVLPYTLTQPIATLGVRASNAYAWPSDELSLVVPFLSDVLGLDSDTGSDGPQVLTVSGVQHANTTDMWAWQCACYHFQTGGFGGTNPSLSATIQVQESADAFTWSNNPIIPAATITGQFQQGTVEILVSQLSPGKRYVKFLTTYTVGGSTPTIPVSTTQLHFNPQPVMVAASQNDFSVVSQTKV